MSGLSQDEINRMMANKEAAAAASTPADSAPTQQQPVVSEDRSDAANAPAALGTLMDVSLPVTIEFGRTRMTVNEVLKLGQGSVIQLERMVGEPIDILVGNRKLAEGEVVVIGEHFGVRITHISSAEDAEEE